MLSWNFDWLVEAINCPDPENRTISLAPSCSRSRSSGSVARASGSDDNSPAEERALFARSPPKVSSVTRPRLRPASSAPSTFTSNQLSIERETNW